MVFLFVYDSRSKCSCSYTAHLSRKQEQAVARAAVETTAEAEPEAVTSIVEVNVAFMYGSRSKCSCSYTAHAADNRSKQ
jgi:hypothetical protein